MTTGEATKSRSAVLIDGIKSSTWSSRIAVALTALLLVLLLVQAVQEPAQFTSQLLIGLTNGAILALVALGYTLVYGIIELINFAHGDNFILPGTLRSHHDQLGSPPEDSRRPDSPIRRDGGLRLT